MWRHGLKAKKAGGNRANDNATAAPQLVAVAVDADKNSQHALRWAADHIISRGQLFLIIHVRKSISTIPTPYGQELPISEVEDEVAMAFQEQMDCQTKELLLPFQCFCSRRGLNCKEIILYDTNVSKAIVDYVEHHGVEKLVLGASSRNAFTRTFKNVDVPTSVSKTAPNFCSVYVISKGKIASARPATASVITHVDNPAASEISTAGGAQFQSTKSELVARNHIVETPRRYAMVNNARTGHVNNTNGPAWGGNDHHQMNEQYGGGAGGVSGEGAQLDYSYQSVASCPSPYRMRVDRQISYIPKPYLNVANSPHNYSSASSASTASSSSERDFLSEQESEDYGFARTGNGGYLSGYNRYSPPQQQEQGRFSNHSAEDMELELRRLKLEWKCAADKYEEACDMSAEADQVYEESRFSRERAFDRATEKKKKKFTNSPASSQSSSRESSGTSTYSQAPAEAAEKVVLLHPLAEVFSSEARYRRYSIEEIQQATDNFSEALRIGEGGYGPVFKCSLDQTPVAVKIPRADVAQGMKQFQQEVEVLSCIRHPNMVLLMGACPEYGCLVYEYMGNGSLEDRLFCCGGTPPLPWQLRFRMAAEIATGLLFLHQTKPEPIVHRDLKPANILLDGNFVSKITDVGLARLIPSSTAAYSARYVATVAAGTFCYIDPEYQKTGTVGVKSDTYALGIILLQMVTARPPMGLTHAVENALEAGRLGDVLDPNVSDWPVEETEGLAKLALACAELRRKDRPDLATVVLPELNRLRELANSATNWHGPCS